MTHTFVIDGKPQAKQRPRFSKGHSYTPKQTVEFEAKVRNAYIDSNGVYFGDKPLEANITFVFPVTKSWSKKKKQDAIEGKLKKVSRPDTDNLAKSILDSLNGIAFKDDSQVVTLVADKVYGTEGATIVWLKDV